MKIWHDNSGVEKDASWFLKYIIVYDLQTGQKYYTFCENWLSAEKGDEKIEKNLFFISKKEFTKLKIKNENILEKISDLHLWYSIFAKPIESSFTRLNRVTSCFLHVYLTMVLITSYFTTSYFNLSSEVMLSMSLFSLTQEQVKY